MQQCSIFCNLKRANGRKPRKKRWKLGLQGRGDGRCGPPCTPSPQPGPLKRTNIQSRRKWNNNNITLSAWIAFKLIRSLSFIKITTMMQALLEETSDLERKEFQVSNRCWNSRDERFGLLLGFRWKVKTVYWLTVHVCYSKGVHCWVLFCNHWTYADLSRYFLSVVVALCYLGNRLLLELRLMKTAYWTTLSDYKDLHLWFLFWN